MLMTTKPMFDLAYSGGFGVGAFNVNNMEIAQAVIEACAAEKAPVILQISKGARQYANIRYLRKIIDACVEEHPEVPIAIHCDHGDTVELIRTCIADGYTSVMIDGSHHPYDENVALTKEWWTSRMRRALLLRRSWGCSAGLRRMLLGLMLREYQKNIEKFLTDPDEAKDFYERTGIDSLAVAIGTSHGAFKFVNEPKLAFDRIEQIMKTCPGLPLVMHGSSSVPQEFVKIVNDHGGNMPNAMGVPEEQIARAVRTYGVCKVNIDTDLRLAMTAKIREVFVKDPEEFDPRNTSARRATAIREMVVRKLEMLNCRGKADDVIAEWRSQGEPMPAVYGAAV